MPIPACLVVVWYHDHHYMFADSYGHVCFFVLKRHMHTYPHGISCYDSRLFIFWSGYIVAGPAGKGFSE